MYMVSLMEYKLNNNQVLCLYDQRVIGYLKFEKKQDIYNITSIFVDEAYRGQGIAENLIKKVLKYIALKNGEVIATCSYAKNYLKKHKNVV